MSKELEQVLKAVEGVLTMASHQVQKEMERKRQEPNGGTVDPFGELSRKLFQGIQEAQQKPSQGSVAQGVEDVVSAIFSRLAPQEEKPQQSTHAEATSEQTSSILERVKQNLEVNGFSVQEGAEADTLDVYADGEKLLFIELEVNNTLRIQVAKDPSLNASQFKPLIARLKADLQTALTIDAADEDFLPLSIQLAEAIQKQKDVEAKVRHKEMLIRNAIYFLKQN